MGGTIWNLKRGILPPNGVTTCPLCRSSEETIPHMLCECKYSSELWLEILKWLKMQTPLSNKVQVQTIYFIIGRRFLCWIKNMLRCKCLSWSRVPDAVQPELSNFSLSDSIPKWNQGSGFGTLKINLGELEVCQVTKFDFIWGCNLCVDGKQGVSFYKANLIPNGFFSLGHYCQSNEKPLRGFVLVAREVIKKHVHKSEYIPALLNPVDYSLVWSSYNGDDEDFDLCGYIWLPQPQEGYKALGFVVTNESKKPALSMVKCVRVDLTDPCEAHCLIEDMDLKLSKVPLFIWSMRPVHRGIYAKGVSVGAFYCTTSSLDKELTIACLKNLETNFHAMPNIDQIHALVRHYGPTLFFHPDEIYLPSSVSWFFRNGALLYNNSYSNVQAIDSDGSNLPLGGTNDGKYWIDLPNNDVMDNIKHGNLESTKLYLHIKPALAGTFTDIAMWVFCPFNGPGTLKVGMVNIAFKKVGQHVGDWEHFTLRISNFTGELWSIYCSQHSGGKWVDAYDLEFIDGNKAIIYSSKNGHASFPHPGNYIQGSSKLGIGLRNDASRSEYYVDSSKQYEIVAAQYLGDEIVKEPSWLQYMRKWGPTIAYDSKSELDKIIKCLPLIFRSSINNILKKLPLELYGEDGPTGPKEKNNWFGDERC